MFGSVCCPIEVPFTSSNALSVKREFKKSSIEHVIKDDNDGWILVTQKGTCKPKIKKYIFSKNIRSTKPKVTMKQRNVTKIQKGVAITQVFSNHPLLQEV